MQAIFYLHCKTNWGEDAYLHLNDKCFRMTYVADKQWKVIVHDLKESVNFSYSYIIKRDEEYVAWSKLNRKIVLESNNYTIEIYDDFVSETSVFQTLPFLQCYFHHKITKSIVVNQWLIQVYVPFIDKACKVGIIGSSEFLGNWKQDKYLPMNYIGNGWWSIAIEPQGVVEYKFVVIDKSQKIILWEDGNNRITNFKNQNTVSVLNLIFKHNFRWKGAGVAIPVFSLRSALDWGIGEYSDLMHLADWAANVSLKVIQILPINDTTNTCTNNDSYPYRANSIYALHPILLNMKKVGVLKDRSLQTHFEKEAALLNKSPFVLYEEVFALKTKYLKLIYEQDSDTLFCSKSYNTFFRKNEHWLLPYAVYSCLREDYKTADFNFWEDYAVYSSSKTYDYAIKNKHRVQYFYFVQYHANKQLKEAHLYANKKGIALKGDLPIGISADSVDAWMNPNLFHLDAQAGAPPDDFSVNGQNWGFPTYNWQRMKTDDFKWWKARFKNMTEYFDAYRIDHILGFFRIWQIPIESIDGILGYFNPALPLSEEDLRNKGFAFSKQMLQPFVTETTCKKLFNDEYKTIVNTFFKKEGNTYKFLPQFSSQRYLVDYLDKNQKFISIANQRNLLDIYKNVLFVEDRTKKNHYHPRIIPFTTEWFLQLTPFQQECFCNIHDDYFYVRHNEFWKKEALLKLPSLLSTNNMLVCGEDLGMIPQCVPDVMNLLQILSLEVQRMPKQNYSEFVVSNQTPYFSVYTTGTHDTSSLREWWRENFLKTQHYYNHVLGKSGNTPLSCTPEVAMSVLENIFSSNSVLTILPLQDILAMNENFVTENPADERINNPANPHHFWCYRMFVDLSSLLENTDFNFLLKKMLKATNRI